MGKLPSLSIGMKIAVAAIGAGAFGCIATAAIVNFEARTLVEHLGAGQSAAESLREFSQQTTLWLVGTVLFSLTAGLFAARQIVGPMNQLEGVLKRLAALQPVETIPYLDRTDVLGRIAHIVGALRDSEQGRRAAEQALSLSEKRLRLAVEGAGVAPWDWDAATDMVTYSERHHQLFGGKLPLKARFPDFIGIVHPDDRHLFTSGIARYLPNREVILQYRVVLPDGAIRRLESRGMPFFAADGSLAHVMGVQWDITAQHEAQEKLQASETRRKLASDAASLMFWRWDLRRNEISVETSPQTEALVTTDVGTAEEFCEIAHPDDRGLIREARERSQVTGADMIATFRRRTRDGGWAWNELRARPLRDDAGAITEYVGVSWDVTERQQHLASIQERTAQLRSVLAAVPDAVLIVSQSGLILSISESAQRLFDLTVETASDAPITRLLPSSQRDPAGSGLPAYLFSGRPQRLRGMRRDGTLFPVEVTASRLNGNGFGSFVLFARDLSERERSETRTRELQAQLFHSTRLSAMGQTASALAHELNQPLAALGNYLEVVQSRLNSSGGGADLHALLGKAIDQAGRATAIVRRIRGFVEKATPVLAPEPLAGLLGEALELALVGQHQVRTELNVAADLLTVHVDRIQIQQVVVNLVRNGAEAASACRGDDALVQITASRAGGEVEISVRDNGPGVDEQRRRNLFRPFNSSKQDGMGIGLSVSRAIVEAHGGRIWVEDQQENQGACFHLTLPLQEAA